MAKYKVGDKVRVRSDLRTIAYGEVTAVKSMLGFAGKIVTIEEIPGYYDFDIYRIEEDTHKWNWSNEMFEGLVEETTQKTEIKLEGNMKFEIKSYKVIKNKVVIVEFEDGDIQRSVCMEGDTFDEERGFEVCIMKHICGGKDKYHKALKVAQQQIKAIDDAKEKTKKANEKTAKKKAKELARKQARKQKKRAEHIEDMKTAFVKALQEYENTPFTTETATKVIETVLENDK